MRFLTLGWSAGKPFMAKYSKLYLGAGSIDKVWVVAAGDVGFNVKPEKVCWKSRAVEACTKDFHRF